MAEGGQDLLHYSCHHLLPLRNSSFRGLRAPTASYVLHAWPIPPIKPEVTHGKRWFRPAIAAALNALMSVCANNEQSTCETEIWWNEKKKKGRKHKQQETSTAITTINKGNTKVKAEKHYYIRSQGQHIKYIWCWNRKDLCLELIAKTKNVLKFLPVELESWKSFHFYLDNKTGISWPGARWVLVVIRTCQWPNESLSLHWVCL